VIHRRFGPTDQIATILNGCMTHRRTQDFTIKGVQSGAEAGSEGLGTEFHQWGPGAKPQ